jgi:hypothetical protein
LVLNSIVGSWPYPACEGKIFYLILNTSKLQAKGFCADVCLDGLVSVAVEVATGGGAVGLPAPEADPAKVKVALGALDMVATVSFLNDLVSML